VQTNDELKKAVEYQPTIVHYKEGNAVKLSDVANVKDSVQDERAAGMSGGEPAILIVIRREAGANIIETVNRIRAE
ncbi:efflux RND transporter permease subunit, partial [Escherichia coli]|nr:efflux RND transporter permease subunit [Escherichia coli]